MIKIIYKATRKGAFQQCERIAKHKASRGAMIKVSMVSFKVI